METVHSDATDKLETTRARLKAAAEPPSAQHVPAAHSLLERVSLVDSVSEGVEQWWHKSTVGRAITTFGPMAEPYLRPLARQHYQALLLGSAAVGAVVSLFPMRSLRTVLKVAGPVLVSSVIYEISKAGIRQMRGKPPPITSSN